MNTKRHVILMIIPHYGHGGAQRVFAQLVNFFSSKYHVVEVSFDNDFDDKYSSKGEKVCLHVPAGTNLWMKAFRFLQRCFKLSILKLRYKPKFTISHLEGANFVNALSFGSGKRILCIHGSRTAMDSNRKGAVKLIENRIFTPLLYNIRANRIVCVSKGIYFEMINYFGVRKSLLTVITNGIPLHKIQQYSSEPVPYSLSKIFEKAVMVFCGRLVPQKNPLALLDIVYESGKILDFNVLIIGDGPLLNDMKHRCDDLNIPYSVANGNQEVDENARIFFAGFQENPFNLMKHSAIFVSTSDFEGYPLVLCEAFACGLPVVATDCPTGVREILDDDATGSEQIEEPYLANYGILMPLVSQGIPHYSSVIKGWSETLIQLLRDEDQRRKYSHSVLERAKLLDEQFFLGEWDQVLNAFQ